MIRDHCHFKPDWFKQYPWLYYSPHVDGAFCRGCMLFAPDIVCRQIPGQFITKPFKMWVVKSKKINGHATSEYHVMSLARMEVFINRYRYPSEAVNTKLHKEAQAIIEANQKVAK